MIATSLLWQSSKVRHIIEGFEKDNSKTKSLNGGRLILMTEPVFIIKTIKEAEIE